MKLEGEYAVDKWERAHRITSGIVWGVWVGLALYTHGPVLAFRIAVFYLVPMTCIWLPEAMASYTRFPWSRIDERSHPTFLRWGGWFLLLFVPVFFLILFALNK